LRRADRNMHLNPNKKEKMHLIAEILFFLLIL